MNVDNELEAWRREWQSAPDVSPALHRQLRKKVERQSLFMRLALAGEILTTILIGGATTWRAVQSPQPDVVVLAAMTWVFFAAAWIFRLRLDRGKWSPAGQDAAAFLDLSIWRCRGQRTALRFAMCLFVVELIFCLGWIYRRIPPPRPSVSAWLLFSSHSIDIVWAATAAFFGFVVWMGHRKRGELGYLLNLIEQLKGKNT